MAASVAATPQAFAAPPHAHMQSAFIEYEEEIRREPYSIRTWWSYLQAAQASAPPSVCFAVYERALAVLPRSYKLWKAYLDEYYERCVRGKRLSDAAYTHLVALYERALVQLQTMPRLWLDYLALLQHMQRLTASRHVLNRALRALPITQHRRVWKPMVAFVKMAAAPTAVRATYRRYLMLEPSKREEYVEYLCGTQQYGEASTQLVLLINQQNTAPSEKTTHSLWMQLCDMISQHPTEVPESLNVDAILRSGISRFTDEVGRLWCSLATYYVRMGLFESARDIYEEGIETVVTVRDFSMIFDAYVQFVEAMLTTEMELVGGPDSKEEEDDTDMHQVRVDRLLKIYEDVAERRPVLLNSVLLRQNPNNVREWEKRVELHRSDPQQVIRTYADAVRTVDAFKSGGRLNALWIKFARFYEENARVQDARAIFQKAVEVTYRTEQELAEVYCAWAEMELRLDNLDEALAIVRKACTVPTTMTARLRQRATLTTKDKLHLCVKLWVLRLDLEEGLGDLASTRAAYDQSFELRLITPQMVLNYAAYLEENKYFEESFRVYERGLALFPKFPHASALWEAYLDKFVTRYGGKKVERARDLHEQAIAAAPAKYAKALYTKYAEFEEKHGMLRNVMAVYERATDAVPEDEQLQVYITYIKKAHAFFGVAKVREVYQRGIDKLADKHVPAICLKFATMETKLGEFERARAIYAHASQFCDPRLHETSFWKVWHDFEVAHGSEHSFLEMLRIKRSVVAQYSTVTYMASEPAPSSTTNAPVAATAATGGMVPATEASSSSTAVPRGDAMAALEAQVVLSTLEDEANQPHDSDMEDATGVKRAVSDGIDGAAARNVRQKVIAVTNEEEIDLDDEDEDEDEDENGAGSDDDEGNERDVEERAIPATLYGNVKTT